MKPYYLSIFIIFNILLSNIDVDTPWGKCTIINNGTSFKNTEIEKILLKKINKLNNTFNVLDNQKSFNIIIDNNQFKTNNPHWKWALGITYSSPERIIIKDPANSHISKNRFKTVLEHELNHIMVNRLKNSGTVPRWFKEGFAMFYSNEVSLNHRIKIAKNIHVKEYFNLSNLNKFTGFNKSRFDLAYAQSAIYILTINKLFGEHSSTNIYNNMLHGMNFEQAFYSTTSKSLSEFNDILYPHLKKKYKWFKLITLPNQMFAFFPLLLIIGFIMRSIKNKKIEKRWILEEEIERLESLKIDDEIEKN